MAASALTIALATLSTTAGAQSVTPPPATRITPDTAPGLSTGTAVNTGDGVNWFVSGGTYAGPAGNPYQNLFHSFRYFDVKTGDVVVWAGDGNAGSVRNVINRVSGGDPSLLFGSLNATAFGNANFYFINPAGIVFGSSFHVNVSQGLYFSTATSLRFADNLAFMASTANGSSFSIAAPASFGFVGNSGDIQFDQGPNISSVAAGRSALAQFSAPNIVLNGAKLVITDTDMRLIAVGPGALNLSVDGATALPTLSGRVSMTNATVNTTGCICAPLPGQRQAAFGLYGGTVTLTGSLINSVATPTRPGGDIRIVGGNVLIDHSTLAAATKWVTDGGAIDVSGSSVTLDHATLSTSTSSAGNAGSIQIATTQGLLSDSHSTITSVASDFDPNVFTPGVTGATGDIRLSSAGDIRLTGTTIGTQADDYSARAGGIDIVAAGNVAVRADTAEPGTGAAIFAISHSLGTYVPPASGAPQGGIRISGGRIDLTGVGQMTDRAVHYPDRVNITSSTTGEHPAGDIVIAARDGLNLTRADLLATTVGPVSAKGNGGALRLSATNLTADNALFESSSLSGGDAGGTTLTVTDTLRMSNFSVLSSASSGKGKAGNILINLGRTGIIDNGSRIDSDVSGQGSVAGSVIIAGAGATLEISSTGPGTPEALVTTLSTSTGNGANGGAITINVASLHVSGGANVVSNATSNATGSGGAVTVTAPIIKVEGQGSVIAATALSASRAGSIDLSGKQIEILNGGAVSTNAFNGIGGSIKMTAQLIRVEGTDAEIASEALGTGQAGSIDLNADQILILNGGDVTTNSVNGPGGAITMKAQALRVQGLRTAILSQASGTGQAGSINLTANSMFILDGGAVSTNSTGGTAGKITLTLPRTGVLQLAGTPVGGSITTNSGPQSGGEILISDPLAIIANGSEITALGQIKSARADISSNYFIRSADRFNKLSVDGVLVLDSQIEDVSRGTNDIESQFVDAGQVLSGRCASSQASGRTSQLGLSAPGPYSLDELSQRRTVASCGGAGKQ